MKIALSKGSGGDKYAYYAQWLRRYDHSVEIVDLACDGYNIDRARQELQDCAGIVFTGGSDIDPTYYGAGDRRSLCGSVDSQRDDFEFELLRLAQQYQMPVLGICRGAQLINVAFGGSLIVDVPTERSTTIQHTKCGDRDSEHSITVEAGTTLGKLLRCWEGTVNSAHHQAIERLGSGLRLAATSPDGIIEAVESSTPDERGFLIAVQWHPERMRDEQSPFSRVLAERFLFECRSYNLLLQSRSYDRDQFMTPPDDANGGV